VPSGVAISSSPRKSPGAISGAGVELVKARKVYHSLDIVLNDSLPLRRAEQSGSIVCADINRTRHSLQPSIAL
jgi:hypothetical protein